MVRDSVGVEGAAALQPFDCGPGVACEATLTFLALRATETLDLDGERFLDIQMYNADPIVDEIVPDPADPMRRSLIRFPAGARVYVSGLHDGESAREGAAVTVTSDLVGVIDWEARTFELLIFISDGEGSSVTLELYGDIPNFGPEANAGPDRTVECSAPGGARVPLSGVASRDPEGELSGYSWAASDGEDMRWIGGGVDIEPFLPLGDTHIALSVRDRWGVSDVDGLDIRVVDTTGPSFESVDLATDCLWSPDHDMHLFRIGHEIEATARDLCDGDLTGVRIVDAFSDQPVDADGDGATEPDVLFGSAAVCLRSERDGRGPAGRTYTIVLEAEDSHGNVTRYPVDVSVPHDQRRATRCDTAHLAPGVALGDPRCEAELPTAMAPAAYASGSSPPDPASSSGCGVSSVGGREAVPAVFFVLVLGWVLRRRA